MKLKKGFMFSLFVITALSLIVFSFKMRVEFKQEERSQLFQERVENTNMFIEDIEQDIERSLYVASYRAFLAIDEYFHKHEAYIDDVNASVIELMLNGTLNNEEFNSTNSSTFGDWTKRIEKLGSRYNINITFNNISINTKQTSPWNIEVSFSSLMKVEDFTNEVGWEFHLVKATTIDIAEAGFADPIYFIEGFRNYNNNMGTNNTVPLINSIKKSPYNTLWVNNSGDIDTSNLNDYIKNQYYTNSSDAPSYLMRLMGETDCSGDFSEECKKYGIESFVDVINKSNVWAYSWENVKTCAVDYQFFMEDDDCNSPEEQNHLINMSTKFVLDRDHMKSYNLTEINST